MIVFLTTKNDPILADFVEVFKSFDIGIDSIIYDGLLDPYNNFLIKYYNNIYKYVSKCMIFNSKNNKELPNELST